MRCQFYHAIALCALIAPGCGRPASDAPASTTANPISAPAAPSSAPATPTADAVKLGREIIERVRAAGGGAKLTALRSFEATGTSTMSAVVGVRNFSVRALYPGLYRQEEIPTSKGGLAVAIGLQAPGVGWMIGAQISGDGRSSDAAALQTAYTRAATQAMAAVLAGVNAPWLVDSGQFTPLASGKVGEGDDRDLFIVSLEGPHGRAGRLLIDPATNLPCRFIEPPLSGTGGEAGRNELNFSYQDFRDVEGVMLPHTIVRHVGRIQTTWSIAKYKINPPLRPTVFTRKYAMRVK